MQPISDRLLDQLSDELKQYAVSLSSESKSLIEDHEAKTNNELASMMNEVATDRALLVRFAFLLRSHSTRASALAELTGAK